MLLILFCACCIYMTSNMNHVMIKRTLKARKRRQLIHYLSAPNQYEYICFHFQVGFFFFLHGNKILNWGACIFIHKLYMGGLAFLYGSQLPQEMVMDPALTRTTPSYLLHTKHNSKRAADFLPGLCPSKMHNYSTLIN